MKVPGQAPADTPNFARNKLGIWNKYRLYNPEISNKFG
jgi:hypothetical protein